MKYQLILFAIVLASCKSPTENSANVKSIELEQLETSIDSLFISNIGENEPGAALLVAYDGQMIIGKGFGLRDIERKEPITKSTNMRMGSVSKQFTALTILKLDHNAFGTAGLSLLAENLRTNNQLILLSLSYCNLDEKSAELFFEILLYQNS